MESALTFSFSITQILGLMWLVVLVVYIIFSLIFVYHWRAYATNATIIRRTLTLYFISSGLLMLSAGVALVFV